jgi:molecular chaperone IbpA
MGTLFPVGQLAFGPGFKDFDKFFVGFDDHVNRLTRINEEAAKTSNNYPPYNIKKTGANSYIIELAVAGFDRSDIDIEVEGDKLIVRGNVTPTTTEYNPHEYVFKGIAERAFTRSFSLLGNIKVESADLKNGMLRIYLMGQEEVSKKIRIAIE